MIKLNITTDSKRMLVSEEAKREAFYSWALHCHDLSCDICIDMIQANRHYMNCFKRIVSIADPSIYEVN